MAHFTRSFISGLPLIEVQIRVGRDFRATEAARHDSPRTPIRLRALIDTGASSTIVDRSVFEALRLPRIGVATMQTLSSTQVRTAQDLYDVDLSVIGRFGLDDALELLNLRVTSAEIAPAEPFRVVLGRDVLRHCLLTCNGTQGWLTLAY